mgnify:CR=1 FL=1
MSAELVTMKNIGPRTAEWLREIGVQTRADLERLGAVEAYWLIQSLGYNTTAVLLYALQGALLNVHWNELPAEMKDELKEAAEGYRFTE